MLSAIAVYYSPAIMQMAPAAMELANTLYACHQAVCSAGLRAIIARPIDAVVNCRARQH